MADHLRTELVLNAVGMAITTRTPAAGTVHHFPSTTSHRQNRRIPRSRVATVLGWQVSASSASQALIACRRV